jgi:hypothetical protein
VAVTLSFMAFLLKIERDTEGYHRGSTQTSGLP